MNKLGIFGGTFNPIHFGHLIVAQETLEIMKLDEIIFVPSAIPPHKELKNVACAKERLAMIKLALKSNPNFTFSDIELTRSGKSYTVDTLKKFRELHPKSELFFMVGADNLKEIMYWKDPEGILKQANLIVMTRPGYLKLCDNPKKHFPLLSKNEFKNKINMVKVPEIGISGTLIRNNLKNNKSIDYLMPVSVEEYILKRRLYST
ncbi:nicotinate-nucleotide adenylyltransferase [Candidatus Poribacteria bacterium]|nr:nicotinate-nucleotide adenylyltransferase [Candidatus Poribacteria bacterium]